MAIITIETPFNIDLEFKVAAIAKRLLAWLIDMIFICVYCYLTMRFLYPLISKNETIKTSAAYFAIIIPIMLYQVIAEVFMNGQTFGKMAVGIKVIDRQGGEPTIGQYLLRWLLCFGNFFIFILPFVIMQNIAYALGYMIGMTIIYIPDILSMAISAKTQRLGDLAAGTVIIDKNYKPDISETIYQEVEQKDYQPLFPQVMRLTDRDINGIRNLLKLKKPTKDTEHYIIDVAHKIKTLLNIETDMYPTDFLQQLLQDYNYITGKK